MLKSQPCLKIVMWLCYGEHKFEELFFGALKVRRKLRCSNRFKCQLTQSFGHLRTSLFYHSNTNSHKALAKSFGHLGTSLFYYSSANSHKALATLAPQCSTIQASSHHSQILDTQPASPPLYIVAFSTHATCIAWVTLAHSIEEHVKDFPQTQCTLLSTLFDHGRITSTQL